MSLTTLSGGLYVYLLERLHKTNDLSLAIEDLPSYATAFQKRT